MSIFSRLIFAIASAGQTQAQGIARASQFGVTIPADVMAALVEKQNSLLSPAGQRYVDR